MDTCRSRSSTDAPERALLCTVGRFPPCAAPSRLAMLSTVAFVPVTHEVEVQSPKWEHASKPRLSESPSAATEVIGRIGVGDGLGVASSRATGALAVGLAGVGCGPEQ